MDPAALAWQREGLDVLRQVFRAHLLPDDVVTRYQRRAEARLVSAGKAISCALCSMPAVEHRKHLDGSWSEKPELCVEHRGWSG